jgi:hypothetical protein
MDSEARVAELFLDGGEPAAHISCEANLIPTPGRYLLARAAGTDPALAVPLFCTQPLADGFLAAPPLPRALPPEEGLSWAPGTRLLLRGPLGHGFTLPATSRRVALAALDSSAARLLALLGPALHQEASIVLICKDPPSGLPLAVEVQPLAGLHEALAWADYMALDAARESLGGLKQILARDGALKMPYKTQILVRAPLPCGGLADCAICAVEGRGGWRLACKDGPVFELGDLT